MPTPFQLFLKIYKLIKRLKDASECFIKWFTNNFMIVNPGKFQSIIIESNKGKINSQSLKINDNFIETSCVKLLGIEIDRNALSCLKSFLNQDQRNIIANSFIYSNFNHCLLIWHFCSKRLMNKIENIQMCIL